MTAPEPGDTGMSAAEHEEHARLASVYDRLQRALEATEARLRDYTRDAEEQKTCLSQNRDEMDHIEKIASRESIEQSVRSGDSLLDKKKRLQKLQRSPYFGRFDVAHEDDDHDGGPVYIGIHHFFDDAARENVVYDWRAPIATLFYDYETGPARYESPQGEVDCTVQLKRQFRISGDEIQLLIDSAVHVVDDVLQEGLGRASDEGMKNIVGTIQPDQNQFDIGRAFRTSARVTLNKGYRSSYEIMQFAQRISPNPDLEPIERHGEEPRVLACGTRAREPDTIRSGVAAFVESGLNTMGVICKTQKRARRTYDALQGTADRLHLLTEEGRTFARSVIVCAAHMAKGLEFDQVLVPEANATNYRTPMDRNLLYVACTRALHRLVLTHAGAATSLI